MIYGKRTNKLGIYKMHFVLKPGLKWDKWYILQRDGVSQSSAYKNWLPSSFASAMHNIVTSLFPLWAVVDTLFCILKTKPEQTYIRQQQKRLSHWKGCFSKKIRHKSNQKSTHYPLATTIISFCTTVNMLWMTYTLMIHHENVNAANPGFNRSWIVLPSLLIPGRCYKIL